MNDERKVLSRWSERKAAARRGEAPPEPADETPAVAETSPLPQDASADLAASDQALPADATPAADDEMPALPSVDELTPESDYTVFLKEKVPEQLRRAALRKLWASDPVLANLDGLNDYDEDYNLTTTVIGAVQSAWQAGRGYAEEVEEKLDKVEEALGGSGEQGRAAEPQQAEPGHERPEQAESRLAGDSAATEPGADALSESDAAGDNSTDAPRRVAEAAPDTAPASSPEQRSK